MLVKSPQCQLSTMRSMRSARPSRFVVRAQDAPAPGGADKKDDNDGDTAFEARLRLMQSKKNEKKGPKVQQMGSKREYDFSAEQVYYEGPPHRGDLAINVALLATIFWLPLTIAALGRGAFVKYRFTDQRMSVITEAPWQNERLDVPYSEVKKVVSVPRGVGLWGDMAVTLKDGSVAELRALDRFKELEAYILKRRDELVAAEKAGGKPKGASSAPVSRDGKGFAA